MKKAYFMPFIFAAALSAAANDGTYTNFLTGVSSVNSGGTPTAVGGNWTVNEVSLSKVDGKNAFEFETQDASPESAMTLTVTAAPADTNTIVRLDLQVTLADVVDLMESIPEAQSAFAVCTNSYNAWNGSEWVALDEVPEGVDDTQTTNLTVELCYLGTNATLRPRTARFSVGGVALHVRTNGSEWVELATTADNFAGLGVSGSGTFAKADASVLLGVAEYKGVKYGSLSNAVVVAESDEDLNKPAINVVRKTDESVEINGGNITIADNGNVKGEITVDPSVPVNVNPKADEFEDAEGQKVAVTAGEFEIPINISIKGDQPMTNLTVVLPMSNKEIVGTPVKGDGNKIKVTIQTATSVLEGAHPDGVKGLVVNSKLRDYLNAHARETYVDANVSSTSIENALKEERKGANENGLPLYQSYALGITPTTSVKPVTVASDGAADGVSLTIPALEGNEPSGDYTIRYKVGDGEPVSTPTLKIPLPAKGAGSSIAVKILFN